MSAMASQITGVSSVCSSVCSDQRKHQRPASLAFVRGIHRWPVDSLHKGSVTWKMFPFDDVIMKKIPLRQVVSVVTKCNSHKKTTGKPMCCRPSSAFELEICFLSADCWKWCNSLCMLRNIFYVTPSWHVVWCLFGAKASTTTMVAWSMQSAHIMNTPT